MSSSSSKLYDTLGSNFEGQWTPPMLVQPTYRNGRIVFDSWELRLTCIALFRTLQDMRVIGTTAYAYAVAHIYGHTGGSWEP